MTPAPLSQTFRALGEVTVRDDQGIPVTVGVDRLGCVHVRSLGACFDPTLAIELADVIRAAARAGTDIEFERLAKGGAS